MSVIPQGGVLEDYASGAQGPVGALSEAREYEDRCVHSTALGSIPKVACAAFPRGINPGKACDNHALHREAPLLPQPPPAGYLANSNIDSYHP